MTRPVELPAHPQPVEVFSADKSIVVAVDDWGYPTGVQLEENARRLGGTELATRIMGLYEMAKTIALAVRNVEHHNVTNTWVPAWPTPTHVEILRAQLDF